MSPSTLKISKEMAQEINASQGQIMHPVEEGESFPFLTVKEGEKVNHGLLFLPHGVHPVIVAKPEEVKSDNVTEGTE